MTTLQVGSAGAAVGDLQQRLVEAGMSISANEISGAYFGPSTRLAVEDFQRLRRLEVDGIVGPMTWASLQPGAANLTGGFIATGWHCYPSEARPEVRRVLKEAIDDIGICEEPQGSNRGPKLAKFFGATGLEGQPWCALAASWWIRRCDPDPITYPLASAYKWKQWAEEIGRIVPPGSDVLPGDVGILVRPNGHGHVELIVHDLRDGRLCHVGGNVGDAVRGTVRPREFWTLIARPIPLR